MLLDSYVEQAIRRHEELIREAERHARVSEALAARPHAPRLGDRALALVGRQLVGLGERLQAGVGLESSRPAVRLVRPQPSAAAYRPDCESSEAA